MNRFYMAIGTLILGLFFYADYRGWSTTAVNEVQNVPQSVRDNPGVYRSHYTRYFRK